MYSTILRRKSIPPGCIFLPAAHILPAKRGNQDEKESLPALAAGKPLLLRRRRLADDRLRADLRGSAAVVPVHTRLGLGGAGGRCADLRRLGADLDLQEVRRMKVRMVCIRVPRFMGGMLRWMAGRRRT